MSSLPLDAFALVVCRRADGRFLLVRERKHDQAWYLPAGRVDPGETFAQAAVRETREEAGVDVRLTGVLRVEHRPRLGRVRLRVFFAAVPVVDDASPKADADEHSLGAQWLTVDDALRLPLRGDELDELLPAIARGRDAFPLSVLDEEGARW